MATQGKFPFTAVRTLSGYSIPRHKGTEGGAQSFKKGAPVVFDASGLLVVTGADPALIAGVSQRDASGVAATEVIFDIAHPDTLFRGYADTGGAEGTGTITQSIIGKSQGITASSAGGFWMVDLAKVTTAGRVVVWEFWSEPNFGIGDLKGHVIFAFKLANCQMFVGT
jgi:hypothetical protein